MKTVARPSALTLGCSALSKRHIALVITLAGIVSAGMTVVAHADTYTYTYTGAEMTGSAMGDIFYPEITYIDVPYGMTLDGSMTFSTPLAPNLVDAAVTPIAMTLNLGQQTPLAGPYPGPGGVQFNNYLDYEPAQYLGTNDAPPATMLFAGIAISTDSTGAITDWNLNLISPYSLGIFAMATITTTGDTEGVYPQGAHEVFYTTANTTPGTWAEEAQAPEIDPASAGSAVTLLALCCAILSARRRTQA